MVWYRVTPTWNLVFLPVFVLMMVAVPFTAGLWLSAMAIRFRDVKFAMHFVIRMLMYSAPIIYSASRIPDPWRYVYSLNPIVGVIEGYRATLLGNPIPWEYILPGMGMLVIGLFGGLLYFRRMERVFVDVI
jgi:lipopolysaccharide transport system permease protein